MSFWKGVKSAFGFSGSESEEDVEEYDSSLPTYAAQPTPADQETVGNQPDTPSHEQSTPDPDTTIKPVDTAGNEPTETHADDSLPGDIFDALIEQFNSFQPEFVKECLSTEAQRTYIYNSISENLRLRIQKATATTQQTDDSSNQTEIERLKRRISVLEAEAKDTDNIRQENHKLQLSIKRQKRALLDRINDLEAQVAKNYAEREKFFSDKRNPADAALIDSTNARVKELEATLAQRDEEIAARTGDMDQMMMKIKIGDQMITDLRNQSDAARNEYEDTCNQQQICP